MKKISYLLLFILTFNLWAKGDEIPHYKLIKTEKLNEFSANVNIYEHIKTKARVLTFHTNDDEKTFAINFKTHPEDNFGTPHILEHSVLCGSKKYPLKDPFVVLLKGSLKTFLNAFTYPDRTGYPVSSRNEKDFMNLMDVYLDAVFHPNLLHNENILRQEGWHYEYDEKSKSLDISGVVYGEMQGAYSSPERLFGKVLLKNLFPQTPYSFDSGGDPKEIPLLTQDHFINFYKTHYHPSNATIYLYGNGDMKKYLTFIDKEYLSHYEQTKPIDHLEDHPKMTSSFVETTYSSSENEKEASYMSLSYRLGKIRDPKVLAALDILSYYLGQSAAAPLKQKLIDKKFAKDIQVELESGLAWPFFTVYARNADASRSKDFFEEINKTLEEILKKGLDNEILEGALKKSEFALREFPSPMPVGLAIYVQIIGTWSYSGDPLSFLRFDEIFSFLKENLKKGYFENLITTHLLKNTDTLRVVMRPSATQGEEERKAHGKKMKETLSQMSQEQIKKVLSDSENLKKSQITPDTESALKTIPLLKRNELGKKIEVFPLKEEKLNDSILLTHDVSTKGIAYLALCFDSETIPYDLIPYIPLFNRLMGDLDTTDHDYEKISKLLDLYTGGLSFEIFADPKFNNKDDFHPKVIIKAKSLYESFPQMLPLLEEILLKTEFKNKKRIKELIQKEKTNLDALLSSDGMKLSNIRENAHLSRSGVYKELVQGISYIRLIKDIEKNLDTKIDDVISKLEKIKSIIFSRKNLIVSLSAEKKELPLLSKNIKNFIQKMPLLDLKKEKYPLELLKAKEAIIIPGNVQYVIWGSALSSYEGSLKALGQYLNTDYLWNRVRVQNGAYGAFASFSTPGPFIFASYRDPHIKKTLDIYRSLGKNLKEAQFTPEEMNRLIIGTIALLDQPIRPYEKGNVATALYLTQKPDRFRQKERDQILSLKARDITKWGDPISKAIKDKDFIVAGSKAKIESEKNLFDNIIDLTN